MDPYKILDIDKDASPDEIRRAYRKKAAQYHPDKGGDAWIFQQIQDSYDELTGKRKKKKKKKKAQGTQSSGEQSESASNQQYTDPFGFDTPDPQPANDSTYRQQRPPKRKSKKKKSNAPLVFAACGTVLSIVAIGFLIWWFNQSGTATNQTLASDPSSQGSTKSDTQMPSIANGLAGRQSPEDTNRELEPTSVSLTVTPSDADIVVSGTGVTVEGSGRNRTIQFSSPDPDYAYKLIATMQGYQSFSDEIQIKTGEHKRISITLQRQPDDLESSVAKSTVIEDTPVKDIVIKELTSDNDHTALQPELVAVSELDLEGAENNPWISEDGLTLYWTVQMTIDYKRWVWCAKRKDSDSIFESPVRLIPASDFTLSKDELEMIIFQDGVIMSTTRASTDDNFRRPTRITELTIKDGMLASPCLFNDDNSLLLDGLRKGKRPQFQISSRQDRGSSWRKPKPLDILPNRFKMKFAHMTDSGDLLFCMSRDLEDTSRSNIVMYRKNRTNGQYDEASLLESDNLCVRGLFPRYSEKTRELFFAEGDGGVYSKLMVLRNFDPNHDWKKLD